MKQKWDINGKGAAPQEGGGGYNGPDLPKGSWPAKVKRVEITKIKAKGANHGKPRIRILLEVQTRQLEEDKWQYHGAPVWDGLNIIEGSEGFTNAFLHALTDGSERAKKAIESAFWDEDKGPDIKKVRNKKTDEIEVHIQKIGRVALNSPGGDAMVQITTRPGFDNQGRYSPDVTGYIPYTGDTVNDVEADDDSDDVDDDDDMMDAVDDDDYEDDDISDEGDELETATVGSRKKPPF